MIQIAFAHKAALQQQLLKVLYEPKYMYYFATSWRNFELVLDDSDWSGHKVVSLDPATGEVLAFFKVNVDRDADDASHLTIISFTEKASMIVGRDLRSFLKMLLTRYRKLRWGVVVGNPAEHAYDSLIEKCGGRIVGIAKEDVRLLDGSYADYKCYEVLRTDYEAARSGIGRKGELKCA